VKIKRKYLLLIVVLVFLIRKGNTQTNVDFRQFNIADQKAVRSGMDISPDGKYLAIAGMQNFPLFIYDWKNNKIVKEFNVGDWYAGAKVNYSKKGTYLLLQKLTYHNFNANKDKEVDFEIVDANSGKIINKINKVHDVEIAFDESFYLTLTGEGITKYALPSGEKIDQFTVENATNAIAISPNGEHIAVSHKPTLEQVKNSPTIRNDKKAKKAIKPALKYREMVSIYDARTFKRKATVNELYDVTYSLWFNDDGSRLYSYSVPHSKMQVSTAGRQGYIYAAETIEWKPLRASFMSLYNYAPTVTETADKKYLGLVSFDAGFPQVNIYDAKTGRMKQTFNTRQRIWQGIKKLQINDGRASFAFLPNGSIFIATGNYGIIWKPELD
jgi:hypothetical protein